jgi:hypothetical protein
MHMQCTAQNRFSCCQPRAGQELNQVELCGVPTPLHRRAMIPSPVQMTNSVETRFQGVYFTASTLLDILVC